MPSDSSLVPDWVIKRKYGIAGDAKPLRWSIKHGRLLFNGKFTEFRGHYGFHWKRIEEAVEQLVKQIIDSGFNHTILTVVLSISVASDLFEKKLLSKEVLEAADYDPNGNIIFNRAFYGEIYNIVIVDSSNLIDDWFFIVKMEDGRMIGVSGRNPSIYQGTLLYKEE